MSFNKITFALKLCLTCLVFSNSTAYAEASKSSVLELMKVTHMDNMMNEAINHRLLIVPHIAKQMVASKSKTLSNEQKTQLDSIVNDYMSKVNTDLHSEENKVTMSNAYITVAQHHFSQEEVDAQIKFYGSDIGQSIITKHSALVNDYMIAIMPTIMKSSETSIKAILPQMEADINTVLEP